MFAKLKMAQTPPFRGPTGQPRRRGAHGTGPAPTSCCVAATARATTARAPGGLPAWKSLCWSDDNEAQPLVTPVPRAAAIRGDTYFSITEGTRAGRKVNQAAVSAARPELEAERQQMSTAQLTRLSLQKGGKTLSPGMTLKDNGLHTGLVLM